MEWLNYHHLFYFWTVAHEGSLTAAARRLHLTHSTLSAQLRALEAFLGQDLFDRVGRRLVLTPFGDEIAHYAADIFSLGAELVDAARGRSATRRTPFGVGAVGALPKTIIYRLLEPALTNEHAASVRVRQGSLEQLLALAASNRIHVVLSDQPLDEGSTFRLHSHFLGESTIDWYATPDLAAQYTRGFPRSLQGAPLLVPSRESQLRRSLERWLTDHGVRATIVGEVEDAGLLRVFGAHGKGLFPVRSVIAAEVEETGRVQRVGRIVGVTERYYAISAERRVRHPLVAALIAVGRRRLDAD